MLYAWGWTVSVAGTALGCRRRDGGADRNGAYAAQQSLARRGWPMCGSRCSATCPSWCRLFIWYFVIPGLFPAFQQVPGFLLVIFALGFFTSARIAEQVRAGIQSLPRGQRYAGMAVGFSTMQTYRYVILPMAFRIILPPLTSESMNMLQELLGGVCRVDRRTHHVRHAGAGRNLARHRDLPGGDGAVRRCRPSPSTGSSPSSRRRCRCPASSWPAEREATEMTNLDLTFLNWDVISKFVLNGFYFSCPAHHHRHHRRHRLRHHPGA